MGPCGRWPALSLLVIALVTCGVKSQADGSFWWLQKNTAAAAATTAGVTHPALPGSTAAQQGVWCECVAYYLCVDGVINTSGVNVLDIRAGRPRGPPGTRPPPVTNVDSCPNFQDVCCRPPQFSSTLQSTIPSAPTTAVPTLHPDTPCECESVFSCPVHRMVSDGRANFTLGIVGYENFGHSKCPQVLAVCCASEHSSPFPTPAFTTNGLGSTTPGFNTPGAIRPVIAPHGAALNQPRCECVEAYQCGDDGYILTSGVGVFDIRTIGRTTRNPDGTCQHPQVCCFPPPGTSQPFTATTGAFTTPWLPTTATHQPLQGCGTRNSAGIRVRIQGFRDGESQFGEFPWVATVVRREVLMGKVHHLFVGGATLVHPWVVVTAAHKVNGVDKSKLVVRLGEWDTQNELEAYPHQDVRVAEVVMHPKFHNKALYHDIALLFLQEEAKIAPHINSICLAESWDQVDPLNCVINGWGKDAFEEGEYQLIMKSLTLPLVQSTQCQQQLRDTRLGRYFRLHPSFICAGGEEGKDACKGDGGGPLACARADDPTRYLLMGITAWGIGCGEDGVPGVYVNVPMHYEWAKGIIDGRYPPTTTPIPTTTTPMPIAKTTVAEVETLDNLREYEDYDEEYEEEEDDEEWTNEGLLEERRGKKRRRKERRERRRQERGRGGRGERRQERRRDGRAERREDKRHEREERREERWASRSERREEKRQEKERRREERQERRERRRNSTEENEYFY